jgi:hypothetical protein
MINLGKKCVENFLYPHYLQTKPGSASDKSEDISLAIGKHTPLKQTFGGKPHL